MNNDLKDQPIMAYICKYVLPIQDKQTLTLVRGSKILSVQVEDGIICLWALVPLGKETVIRTILVLGTGHEVRSLKPIEFIGTIQLAGAVQLASGSIVYHVFEEK